MPANRSQIHKNKINLFKEWLVKNGWTLEDSKDVYVVVRARHADYKQPIIYFQRTGTNHLTVPFGLASQVAHDFMKWKAKNNA